jgi:D-3-phosphoglycerate dehydrogenase
MGAIGREVAHRARSFGLNVVAWSRSLTPARATELGVSYAASIDEVAAKSSILSLHLALVDRTRRIVNRRVLDLLPERAMLINTARADLIETDALVEAVDKRGLRVALDVFPDEPRGSRTFPSSDIFRTYPSGGLVYGTPHIAAATDQAQLAIASDSVRVIRSFLLEGTVPNVVNVSSSTAARFQLVIRMMDKVGTFANVLAVLKRHGINVEEVTNTVFEGGVAACAKLRLLSRPTEACLAEIKAFDEVLHVDLVTLPMLA